MVTEWVPNQRVVMRANPDYRGNRPAYPEMVLRGIADLTTSELAYRSSEIAFTEVSSNSVAQLEREPSGRLIRKPSVNYVWIGMNIEKPPFNDKDVRWALSYFIDRQQIIDVGYVGASLAAPLPLP